MAIKKIDFKQLMLQKGEKIGMGVALCFMLGLVAVGAVSGINADKPAEIKEDILDKASKIENKLASGPPVSDPKINSNLLKQLNKDVVALKPYLYETDNFVKTGLEDDKRKNPDVLTPSQFEVEVIRAAVRVPMVQPQQNHLRVYVLKPKIAPKQEESKLPPQVQQFLKNFQGNKSQLKRFMLYNRHVPGMVEEYKKMFANNADQDKYDLELVDAAKLDEMKDVQLATTVQPQRMVIVTAAFPYLEQVAAYTRALNQPLDKLSASKELPQFLPLNVERRTLDARGKVKEPWRPLDLVSNYNAVFLYNRLIGTEEEDPALPKVLFRHGLVMARPKLVRGEYGAVGLEKIKSTVKKISQGASTLRVASSPLERINNFDPFGQAEMKEGEKETKPAPQTNPNEPEKKEEAVPDYCLVRFIDTDEKLKPGMTYEYRIQIRVVNPNHGKDKKELAYPSLADPEELTSPWWPKEGSKQTIRATIEPEFYYYGTELDDKARQMKEKMDPNLVNNKEVTYLQAHRWLERVRVNPNSASPPMPVGDWSVCDIPVRRGEYIRRTEPVDLPIWSPTGQAFRLAVAPPPPKGTGFTKARPTSGIPVDFEPRGTEPDLLVDFEGGKVQQSFRPSEKGRTITIREEAAVEYLILRADGTLIVRNSRTDAKDAARKERYDRWKKMVDEARTGKPAGKGGSNDPF